MREFNFKITEIANGWVVAGGAEEMAIRDPQITNSWFRKFLES
jgi:hypothetical protein